ncbi:hypothetical protein EDC94DRAFT_522238, partial [Helicostylum pulchrum]
KEYYHFTGFSAYVVEQQKKKDLSNITVIESGICSCKSANADTFRSYARYMLINIVALFAFYGPRTAKDRFNLYQGRQRAPELMVNMLLHGTSKYNRKKRGKRKNNMRKRKRKTTKKQQQNKR